MVTDPDITAAYRFDRSNDPSAGSPLAVVRARTTADVRETLLWASSERVGVVPRGAGTGLSGGATARDGTITLSTERMRSVRVDPASCTVTAQPGALNAEVKAAARRHGLWYPPDPSSYEICSIGGNVATNAGGLCCVKYGVTTDYVLGMEVVLADGRVIHLGGSTVKDVAGYDLKRLFTGSEGTLGVITEVTLRLVAEPPAALTMVALFRDPGAAGEAVSEIRTRMRPSVLELMDATAIRAVESQARMGLDTASGAMLVCSSDAGGESAASEIEVMLSACDRHGATELAHTNDPDEGEQFMAARRMAIPAVEKLGRVLIEDVGVPLQRIADLLVGIARISEERSTTIATIGHAGDGNFHPLVVFDPDDAGGAGRAWAAFGEVMELALGLGGTISGEHGIGTLKRPWLGRQLGEEVLAISRQIKDALDPLGILNPGKVL